MTEALLAQGAKLIVVACNTASTVALAALRERYPAVPFVGMEPAVKPAAAQTRSGQVGVLATATTAAGEALARLVDRYGRGVTVHVAVPEGLVELVEAGEGSGAGAQRVLAPILAEWSASDVDTIVLGCTHYPFARPLIERLAGPEVAVIDPAPAVARQAARVLVERGLRLTHAGGADGPFEAADQVTFCTSGAPEALRAVVARLVDEPWLRAASFRRLLDR